MSWNFHVRMIGEGYAGESITCERLIAHFVKGLTTGFRRTSATQTE